MGEERSLPDVILTNAPEMFKKYGTCKPEISDHRMIYEEQTEKEQDQDDYFQTDKVYRF